MATTYTWTVLSMIAYPEQDGYQNVVCTVNWQCSGTDGRFSGIYNGATGVSIDPNEPFTPYSQLTQDQVIGWVQSWLGPESVATVYSDIDAQIYQQQTAPTPQPLPWW